MNKIRKFKRLRHPLATALIAASFALLTAVNVSAVLLFEQEPLDGGKSFPSFVGGDRLAENFQLSFGADVTSLSWWGLFDDITLPNTFNVAFHSDDAGLPSNTPITSFLGANATRTATTLRDSVPGPMPDPVFRFDLTLPSAVTLLGGTNYFVSIEHTVSATTQFPGFYWLVSDDQGDHYFRLSNVPPNPWQAGTGDGNLSLAINGVRGMVNIPEPSTLALLACGLMAFSRKRP